MRILMIKTHPDSEVWGHQSKISFGFSDNSNPYSIAFPSLYETTKSVSDKDSWPDPMQNRTNKWLTMIKVEGGKSCKFV